MAAPCVNVLYEGGPVCGSTKKTAPVHSRHHPQYHKYMDKSAPGINAMSAGMREFRKASGYQQAADEAKGRPCQILSPVCTGTAEHLHEALPRGRAGGLKASLRLARTFEACDPCNGYVMENQVWARERGFLISLKDMPK